MTQLSSMLMVLRLKWSITWAGFLSGDSWKNPLLNSFRLLVQFSSCGFHTGYHLQQFSAPSVSMLSCSVVSDSLQLHGLQPSSLLCPRNFPGKDTGVGCHFLLQEIFLTQGSNPYLLHWQTDSSPLSQLGSPSAPRGSLYLFLTWPLLSSSLQNTLISHPLP